MKTPTLKRKIDESIGFDVAWADLPVRDTRRTYSQLLLNTFNMCDLSILKKTFKRYCTPELHSICSYEGVNNPYAPQLTEVRTIENHVDLWDALFKSAPDFLFKGEFVHAKIDPETQCCVVQSKFTFSATRILDVIVAKRKNAQVILEKKRSETEEFITSEKELLSLIVGQLAVGSGGTEEKTGLDTVATARTTDDEDARSRADSFASTITADSQPTEPDDAAIQESNLFDRDSAQMLEGDMFVYADSRPLAESMVINCLGTFTVHLNAENKVHKYVFLYSAMETSSSQVGR